MSKKFCTCALPEFYGDYHGMTEVYLCLECGREVPEELRNLRALYVDWLHDVPGALESLTAYVREHGLQEHLLRRFHECLHHYAPPDVLEARLVRFDAVLKAAGAPTLLEWAARATNELRDDELFQTYVRTGLEYPFGF
jgi:hypothetical protein